MSNERPKPGLESILRSEKIFFDENGIAIFPNLEKLGLIHGFSWGKAWGNMSYKYGEIPVVHERIERFLRVGGFQEIDSVVYLQPGDGDKAFFIDRFDQIEEKTRCLSTGGRILEADALVTNIPGLPLMVKAADCVVFVIYSSVSPRVVSLVHSGREGADGNIVGKTIELIREKCGIAPESLYVGITPSLSEQKFRMDYIRSRNLSQWVDFIQQRGKFYCMDFTGLSIKQLISSGVSPAKVFQYNIDTYQAALDGESFSHMAVTEWKKPVPNGRFAVVAQL